MDYVEESDAEVFTMKLTLVMYRRETGFHSKCSNLIESNFSSKNMF